MGNEIKEVKIDNMSESLKTLISQKNRNQKSIFYSLFHPLDRPV